jgi:hypothetical protein
MSISFYYQRTKSIIVTTKQSKNQSSKTGVNEIGQAVSTIILALAFNLIVVLPSLMNGKINEMFGQ